MTPDLALDSFNECIRAARLADPSAPTPRIVFICGAPRCGTTVLAQALSYAGDLGVVNNLIARFVTNPVLGVRFWQALDMKPVFTGRSRFGGTSEPSEPHEFGRFWLQTLGLGGLVEPVERQPLPWDAVDQIERIARAFAKPTLFKSFAYLWYIEELDAALDDVVWVRVRRDSEAAARSLTKLYEARADQDGEPPLWTSAVMQKTIRESSYLPLLDRCRAQIRDLDEYLDETFARIPAGRQVTIQLGCFKSAPTLAVYGALDALNLSYDPSRVAEIGRLT